jgi:hypothetical protein
MRFVKVLQDRRRDKARPENVHMMVAQGILLVSEKPLRHDEA